MFFIQMVRGVFGDSANIFLSAHKTFNCCQLFFGGKQEAKGLQCIANWRHNLVRTPAPLIPRQQAVPAGFILSEHSYDTLFVQRLRDHLVYTSIIFLSTCSP